jgi:hypothetical protein
MDEILCPVRWTFAHKYSGEKKNSKDKRLSEKHMPRLCSVLRWVSNSSYIGLQVTATHISGFFS